MSGIIQAVQDNWVLILPILVAVASLLANVIPTPKQGTFLYFLYSVLIDFVALNGPKAKDAGQVRNPLTPEKR